MNPRLQKLASDWKTYVALLAAAGTAMSALTDLVKKATEGFAALQGLSPELRWVVAGVVLVVSQRLVLSGAEILLARMKTGNLWKFVDWATQTRAGRTLGLDLKGPPPEIGDGMQRQGA